MFKLFSDSVRSIFQKCKCFGDGCWAFLCPNGTIFILVHRFVLCFEEDVDVVVPVFPPPPPEGVVVPVFVDVVVPELPPPPLVGSGLIIIVPVKVCAVEGPETARL